MKTRTIVSLILSLLVMAVVPVLTVTTVPGADALGLMYLFTVALNPIVSIVIGVLSGWDGKILWYLPLVNAAVYLIASAAVMGFDAAWLIGAAVYFVLGIAAAYIAKAVRARKAGK
ncbi:MAG: hypothetical protein IKI93_07875 [Clostridia bacterium]|nr:hypothetical protein [Clostridia bacterium]